MSGTIFNPALVLSPLPQTTNPHQISEQHDFLQRERGLAACQDTADTPEDQQRHNQWTACQPQCLRHKDDGNRTCRLKPDTNKFSKVVFLLLRTSVLHIQRHQLQYGSPPVAELQADIAHAGDCSDPFGISNFQRLYINAIAFFLVQVANMFFEHRYW